ncbi:MAG: DUF1963 domain-containing protein [Pseudomonadota bacterium]
MWHQIGGRGIDVQGAPDAQADRFMLMQFGCDKVLQWMWGDVGVVQVWITREDMAAGRWENATFTFERH